LCEFAAKKGFDPLVAENWENQGHRELMGITKCMASHFNGSYKMTVVDTFPELCFSKRWLQGVVEKTAQIMPDKLGESIGETKKGKGYWKSRENRRNHLCEFAAKKGFDPLVADNWEKLEATEVRRFVQSMATHFDRRSFKLVIADAFPELCFSKYWDPKSSAILREISLE